MGTKYIALIKQFDDSFYGLLPDFSLSCFDSTKELVLDRLFSMANSYISSLSDTGGVAPIPTSESVLSDKWVGFEVEFLNIRV